MKKRRSVILIIAALLILVLAATLMVACNKKKTATLKLDPNGGELEVTEYALNVGASVADFVADKTPRPAPGKAFVGWFNGDAAVDGGLKMPSGGLTLTAHYSDRPEPTVAHTDFFGGGDIVYTPDDNGNDAMLVRDGLDKKRGSYDAATGVFTFEENDVTMLSGKIVGTQFYYFKALEGQTIPSGSPDGGEMLIGEGDKVTYVISKDKDGKPIESVTGYYTIDTFTGEYNFFPEGQTEPTLIFIFGLNSEGKMVYFLSSGPERGYYIYCFGNDYDASNILYLDGIIDSEGIGSLRAYRKGLNGLEYAYTGYYYLEGEEDPNAPATSSADGDTYVFYVGTQIAGRFRLVDRYAGRKIVDGINAKGGFMTSDGYDIAAFNYDGVYVSMQEVATEEVGDLKVDGFGNVTYKGKSGTYELKQNSYTMFSTSSGNYVWTDEWAELHIGSETHIIRIIVSSDMGPYYMELASAPKIQYWQYDPTRNYGTMFGSLPENAAFYIYADFSDDMIDGTNISGDSYYVWTWYDDKDTQVRINELIDYGTVNPVEEKDGTYYFLSAQLSYTETIQPDEEQPPKEEEDDGTPEETPTTPTERFVQWGYYFHLDNGRVITSQYPEDQHFGDKLYIDMEGTLYYDIDNTGKQDKFVSYNYGTYEMVRIDDIGGEFFTFNFYVEGEMDSYLLTTIMMTYGEDDAPVYTEMAKPRDIIYRSFPTQDRGFVYMLMLDDTHVAIGGYSNDQNDECYVVRGIVEYDGVNKVYTFEPDPEYDLTQYLEEGSDEYNMFAEGCILKEGKWLKSTGSDPQSPEDDVYDDVLYYYDNTFGDDGVSTVYSKNGDYQLALDGFAHAQYQEQSGDPIEGEYEKLSITSDGAGMFLMFTYTQGTTRMRRYFAIVVDSSEEQEKFVLEKRDSVEAGLHYLLYSDGSYYKTSYVVFMGDGTLYDPLLGLDGAYGTYKATGDTVHFIGSSVDEIWTEYHIKMVGVTVEEGEAPEDFEYNLITTYYAETGDNLYMEQNRQALTFDIVGGGRISGNGYDMSQYNDGSKIYYGTFGVLDLRDNSPYFDEYTTDDNWESGKQIVFIAEYVGDLQGNLTGEADDYFLFDIRDDRQSVTMRDKMNGTYAFYNKGAVVSGDAYRTLYLDGYGNASIRNADGLIVDKGEYVVDPYDSNKYLYNGDEESFAFSVAAYVYMQRQMNIYYLTDEGYLFIGDDWSTLKLSTFDPETYFNAQYIDHYGNITHGYFTFFTDKILAFEDEDGAMMYFNVDANNKLYVNKDTFVMDKETGILYAYQGGYSIVDLAFPDDVVEIAYGVFANFDSISVSKGSPSIIDFNNVRKIGDYAFYGTDLYVNIISSEKVTYVGDHAFDMTFRLYRDGSISAINTIYLPAATYIGDYAFCYNNQLNLKPDPSKPEDRNMGTTKLKAVEYIGDHAFSINRRNDNRDEVHHLDLTEVDLAKLTLHPDAFAPGPDTLAWQTFGLPVLIYVSGSEALLATQNWPEDVRACVVVEGLNTEDTFAGVSFYDFSGGTLYQFGNKTDVNGVFGVTRVASEITENAFSYTVDNDGNASLFDTVGDKLQRVAVIGKTDVTFEYSKVTYYRSGVPVTIKFNDDHDALTFTYTASAVNSPISGYEVMIEVADVKYNNVATNDASFNAGSYTMTWYMDEGNDSYIYYADFRTMTATKELYRRTLTSGDYKITFGVSYGKLWTLKKMVKGDVVLYEDHEGAYRDQTPEHSALPYFAFRTMDGTSATDYVVELNEDSLNATFTVKATVLKVRTVRNADETFEATYLYEESGSAVYDLIAFKEKVDGEYVDIVWGGYNRFVLEHLGDNHFRLSKDSASGVVTYDITFSGAVATMTLTVNKGASSTKVMQTEHADKEEYYEVTVIFDADGNIAGLTDKLLLYSYETDPEGYGPGFTINDIPPVSEMKIVTKGNQCTITYTSFVDYTYVFEKDAEGNWTFKSVTRN